MLALSSTSADLLRSGIYFSTDAVVKPAVVLLVEDETFVREMAGTILESAGHRVFQASNAAQAGEVFHRYCKIIELLVTDVVLPGKNGHVLAEELRMENPELKIMFISGYENGTDGPQRGMFGDAYLAKPFSARSLLEKIERLVRG
jgi:two-component system, cell cycle sensor histidine kinase and response regulator CckA